MIRDLLFRSVSALLLALMLAWLPARAESDSAVPFRLHDDSGLPAARLARLSADFAVLATDLQRLLGVTRPAPVDARITDDIDIGYYHRGRIWLPARSDDADLRETWVHELAHHLTGQDSSFVMKEGIASYAVEALWQARGAARPEGWPQYGQSLDAWVALYAARGRLPALRTLFAMPGYQSSGDGDFRSWQAYVIGGSFVGWLLRTQGVAAFREAFRRGQPDRLDALEQAWRAELDAAALPAFDPADYLPPTPRYQRYVQLLARPFWRGPSTDARQASSTMRR